MSLGINSFFTKFISAYIVTEPYNPESNKPVSLIESLKWQAGLQSKNKGLTCREIWT